MIPFNKTSYVGTEEEYVIDAIKRGTLSGDGFYTKKCRTWLENHLENSSVLLTPNCTQALEMAAILIDIQPGDEVIMPSYTFVSTANAFVLRGAKIVFVDIRPDTMNIDETKIEVAITDKTKAIVPVHYAGVACEMDLIMDLANRYDLFVIEDAAQGVMSTYKGKALGSIGHIGAYSFHDTKNYTSGGEGGLLIINDPIFKERAEVVREKGTNRSKLLEGIVDKYTWIDIGSSFLPSELQSAYLYAQLESADIINKKRLELWNLYYDGLKNILEDNYLPSIPESCVHNAHMFYIKLNDVKERSQFIKYTKEHGVSSVFHYIPLHSSPAGLSFGHFVGEDKYTTEESEKLVRLPLYYSMNKDDVIKVINVVNSFITENK
ncbi:dTDP-4-amino-4,6-dideoxygalactose transaminase [Aliivibrio fischeri]|uniref:dTDP-4-amino-4,6-dideoxygalactose transaminase n=1 Tax=Aliivibrio fischeri TaxID=668 RepID=UPI00031AF2C0|nr:dTDP-4-amino-4,6-dideoxygalactose transaminase [Aliivibrio fischeri]OEE09041.1 dTDP-4-amino-4,6-dideoxygalactose transaminase [Aliivibrio fischeri ZF-211]